MTSTIDPGVIVAGVDENPRTLDAIAWAARFAEAAGATLHLVHAIAPLERFFGSALAFSPEGLEAKLTADAQVMLAKGEQAARAAAPGVRLTRSVHDGKIHDVLGTVSAAARLLVIAGGEAGSVTGGHVLRIVRTATVPTLVWREEPAEPGLPVAVGIDESETANRAVQAAFAIAKVLATDVTLAHMWEIGAAVGLGYSQGPLNRQLLAELQAEQEQQITDIVAPIAHDFPHAHTHNVRLDATPIKGLTELSERSRVLVVGSSGRGRVAGAFLGSVSQGVLHHAHCPVLVVR